MLDFFRREFHAEASAGFPRIRRVPDSHVMNKLDFYEACADPEKEKFADCCAHMACAAFCFVVKVPPIDHTLHPYFNRFLNINTARGYKYFVKSVPLLRSAVSQYKIDAKRGVESHVSRAEFDHASSIRSIKAPELRKRVRAALEPVGYCGVDELGWLLCRQANREFRVSVDFGGRSAQLRYVVAYPEFKNIHLFSQFGFERALGLGHGDWDYIVEANVDDVFALFTDVVAYSAELSERIRESVR